MPDLVDTNILVYRFDGRYPRKQSLAIEFLREGIHRQDVRIAHQAILEFVAAVTKPLGKEPPLLEREEAFREAEALLNQLPVLYSSEAIVRTALGGALLYQFSWFDAHMWAHAEHYGCERLISEAFEHDRLYGTVRAHDPFR